MPIRFLVRGMWALLAVGVLSAKSDITLAQTVQKFDLKQASAVSEWKPAHDVASLQASAEGMAIVVGGDDPYIYGPARAYPANRPLWLTIRLKSEQSGMGQVFYFTRAKGTNEPDSVRFPVSGGKLQTARIPLPPLTEETFLRLDPPGLKGNRVTVEAIEIEIRNQIQPPQWSNFQPPNLGGDPHIINSGETVLRHARTQWGALEVSVGGEKMALGVTRPLIGYTHKNETRWVRVDERGTTESLLEENRLTVTTKVSDPDGGEWTLIQRFQPAAHGAIEVGLEARVSQPRKVVFLPLLLLAPGVGSFGQRKNQALFSGLEYLDKDEPSSSEADIIGPGAKRQVPDTSKITLPLMVIQAQNRYIALEWRRDAQLSAVFDSPDRLFGSNGHLMGLIFPGSDGGNREEGNLLPYEGVWLQPNVPLKAQAAILGGRGASVIPAVQSHIARTGLPALPQVNLADYVKTAAAGWLDSQLRDGFRFRHAIPIATFTANPAADAVVFMEWLALHTRDSKLANRLRETAQGALREVAPEEWTFAAVSHVHYPIVPLLYGKAEVGANRAEDYVRANFGRFAPSGLALYRKSPNGLDYGKTHFEPHANGLAAPFIERGLLAAMQSGNPLLAVQGLRLLRALDRYMNTVPRGAQTWEVPLHTPDILASAHLVSAYVRGYELTGELHFLEQARYWAWTGVPFIYLTPPTTNPIGLYATIPVLGATQWVAPNWMGLPVQWCGLVYADAIARLARYDAPDFWNRLADGITISGIQQTWQIGSDPSRVGLLPDSLTLSAQIRNDAAINPGTVQANAIRLFKAKDGKPSLLYDYHVFRPQGVIVHAPGRITTLPGGKTHFRVTTWTPRPYQILLVGVPVAPKVRLNGKELEAAQSSYDTEKRRLILNVSGDVEVEILLEK